MRESEYILPSTWEYLLAHVNLKDKKKVYPDFLGVLLTRFAGCGPTEAFQASEVYDIIINAMVDIWWYGQACFKIKGKSASLVCDPYSSDFTGLKPLKLDANIVCITHSHQDHNSADVVSGVEEGTSPFVISGPGEYEISGVNIVGINSFHDDKQGAERGKNTIYLITVDDVNIVHLGDLGQKKLTQEQLKELSVCDVLLIPVGGVY